jgi:hypothetical protein
VPRWSRTMATGSAGLVEVTVADRDRTRPFLLLHGGGGVRPGDGGFLGRGGRYGLSGPGYLIYNPGYGLFWRRRAPN